MSYLTSEPVPPGFEDEMEESAVIQKQIDNFEGGPLIGTEYVVELHEDGQARPDYFCVLCNTCNDSRSIFTHWTSLTHRTNYLKTHFQKAYDMLQQLRRSANSSNDLFSATTKLVQAIEQHFGRSMQVMAVAGDDFRRFRSKMCSQVRDKFHFGECAGADFVDEARQIILELKHTESLKVTVSLNDRNVEPTTIALDNISSDDDDNFTSGAAQQTSQQAAKRVRKKQDEQQPAYRAVNRSPPPGKDQSANASKNTPAVSIKQQLPTPKELSLQASQIAQERYKWEKFRCLLELQLKQLRDETETYETNPEKHPDYSEEWKLFWNRRYKQLQEEKKCDPNSYDYKPEWITYWQKRRVELFDIAVNKIKKELKEKFKLSDEDEEHTKELMERYKIRVNSPKNVSTANASTTSASGTGRRKASYRDSSIRPSNSSIGSDAVIDISDDEQQPPAAPTNRNNRRSNYVRSVSSSLSPKRGRPPPPRMGRRSRTRSPINSRHRRHRSRSRSRSPHRRSRSPYSRGRERSLASRGHDDYGERVRERSGDYYRERGDSYSRSSRTYEPVESFRVLDSRFYPEYSQPGQRSTSPAGTTISSAVKDTEPVEEPDGPLTVVSVLRMLSALEDQLGSLGPKALNLLSKALAMEKIKPNAADDLLLNEDNCVFMETVKEKLKGILIADVLDDPQKVRVVKKLISNIATIIFQVTSKCGEESAHPESKHAELVKKKDYQLPFDRQIVASKLASALVMNGLDNLSIDDMNKLLHFFTLLVKTHHGRRKGDRGTGLSFTEVPLRLGLANANSNSSNHNEQETGVLDIDICELMKEVEHHLAKDTNSGEATKTGGNDASNNMESLTDSDLQTLLQNFKFLSNEEQVHLIGHLRKLEKLEPSRVERLRKYVNIAELSCDGESCSDYLSRVVAIARPTNHDRERDRDRVELAPSTTRLSIGSGAAGGALAVAAATTAGRGKSSELDIVMSTKAQRRLGDRTSPKFMVDDDDDDDYNFDDLVMKANDSNGKKTTATTSSISADQSTTATIVPAAVSPNALTFKPATRPKILLRDTERIIANLMGTLASNSNQTGSATKPQQQQVRLPQQRQQKNPHQLQQQQAQAQAQQQLQLQLQSAQPPTQFYPSNGDVGMAGKGNYYNYGGDQLAAGPGYPNMPQQSQPPQLQQPYQMGTFNAYAGAFGDHMNAWGNGPPPPFSSMPPNFMPQPPQHQAPHYSNIYGRHH